MGKALAGIQVRNANGARCSFTASLVRNLFRVVDALGGYLFGFIVALFSERRQRSKYVDLHATVLYHPASQWLPVHGDLRVPAALEKGVYTEEFTVVDSVASRAIRQEASYVVK